MSPMVDSESERDLARSSKDPLSVKLEFGVRVYLERRDPVLS